MSHISRIAIATAVATGAFMVFSSGPAWAENSSRIAGSPVLVRAHSSTVTYSDLDLTTADGQKALNRRVKTVIRVVCTDVVGIPADPLTVSTCGAATWAKTRPQVASAVYRSHQLAGNQQRTLAVREIKILPE